MIEVESVPGVLILTLNRPEKRNALTIELLQKLIAEVKTTKERVIVLRGNGPSFCAGLDLSEIDRREELGSTLAEALKTLYEAPQLVIASVHGAIYAGGIGLMAAADVAISSSTAEFCLPEVHKGIVPALVTTLLKVKVAETYLAPLILLGEKIGADGALKIGLVHEVVNPDELMTFTRLMAEQALKAAPKTLVLTKKFIKTPVDFHEALAIHQEGRDSEEAKEGLSAFYQKRKPFWNN